jgi:LuxR family transcriptional regulator, maltose regulon positive regulatory protein
VTEPAIQIQPDPIHHWLPPLADNHPRTALPVLPPATIVRQRLVDRLDAATRGPLTLISGPAGAGKTTLVASWARRQSGHLSWLSLDEGDRDPRSFIAALVAAVRRTMPGAMARSGAMLRLPDVPDPHHAGAVLASDFADLSGPLTLVLDDTHLLEETPSNLILEALLRFPPEPLHLVMMMRSASPALRRLGNLNPATLRDADLRLTRDEAITFAASAGGDDLDPDVIDAMHVQTEGWAAGMRLLLLGGRADTPSSRSESSVESERAIADLFIDEVLGAQPTAMRDLLLAISVVDRVTPDLADTLIGSDRPGPGSRKLLELLAERQVFITRFGTDWYRPHALFRAALLTELERQRGPGAVRDLRQRAAAWFSAEGLVDDAIALALLANDGPLAARIVVHHAESALLDNRAAEVVRWIEALPPAIVSATPRLLAWRAWGHFHRNDFLAGAAATDELEQALRSGVVTPGERDALSGELDALRGYHAGWFGESTSALKRVNEALRRLPEDHRIARISATTVNASLLYERGDRAGALALIAEGLGDPGLPRTAETLFGISRWYLSYVSAQVQEAESAAREMLRRGEKRDNRAAMAMAHLGIALARYERNDLEPARHHFGETLRLREFAPPMAELDASIGLALTLQATGDAEGASATLNLHIADLHLLGGSPWLSLAESARARLALRQGDLRLAAAWLAGAGDHPDQPRSSTVERSRLTQALTLLALGGRENLALAESILREQIEEAVNLRMVQRGLRSRAILALVLDARDAPEARQIVRELLQDAAPLGYTRLFLDLGAPMEALIRRSAKSGHASALLALFAASPGGYSASAPRRMSDEDARIAASLTPREAQLLRLLHKGATNKEIAAELGIESSTVKRHATGLYGKLGAHNRREAVVTASQIGLLPLDPP